MMFKKKITWVYYIHTNASICLDMKECLRNTRFILFCLQNLRESSLCFFFLCFFFFLTSECEKYRTFLSKVRSSWHVMLSKIAACLSTRCSGWQTNFSLWQPRNSKGHCYAQALELLLEKNFMTLKIRTIAVLYGDCMKSHVYSLHSFELNQYCFCFFSPYPQRQRFSRWLFLKNTNTLSQK